MYLIFLIVTLENSDTSSRAGESNLSQFTDTLVGALAENNGELTMEQVVELVPPMQRPTLMEQLNGAKHAGLITLNLKKTASGFELKVRSVS